jgi:hypothetical protein
LSLCVELVGKPYYPDLVFGAEPFDFFDDLGRSHTRILRCLRKGAIPQMRVGAAPAIFSSFIFLPSSFARPFLRELWRKDGWMKTWREVCLEAFQQSDVE